MKKHKIKIYHRDKQVHTQLLEYRSFLGLFSWWGVKLHRSGTFAHISHYVYAWSVEFKLDIEKDVEDLSK